MRTTVEVDEQVYRTVRERAQRTGVSVGRLLGMLVEQALAAEADAPLLIKNSHDFSVVAARPGSPQISAEAVQTVLDSDGMI